MSVGPRKPLPSKLSDRLAGVRPLAEDGGDAAAAAGAAGAHAAASLPSSLFISDVLSYKLFMVPPSAQGTWSTVLRRHKHLVLESLH